MIDEHWSDRLSAYVDDELSEAERAAADTHLRACEACRTTLEDFQAIRQWVRGPAPLPTSDPWPAIASRIAATRRGPGWQLRWAAAVLLPLVIGAGLWWAGTIVDHPPSPASPPSMAREYGELRANIATLERRFQDVEHQLDPQTAAAIREGLAELDAALTQAERELEQDGNRQLLEALMARAWRQKLRLLQSVTPS